MKDVEPLIEAAHVFKRSSAARQATSIEGTLRANRLEHGRAATTAANARANDDHGAAADDVGAPSPPEDDASLPPPASKAKGRAAAKKPPREKQPLDAPFEKEPYYLRRSTRTNDAGMRDVRRYAEHTSTSPPPPIPPTPEFRWSQLHKPIGACSDAVARSTVVSQSSSFRPRLYQKPLACRRGVPDGGQPTDHVRLLEWPNPVAAKEVAVAAAIDAEYYRRVDVDADEAQKRAYAFGRSGSLPDDTDRIPNPRGLLYADPQRNPKRTQHGDQIWDHSRWREPLDFAPFLPGHADDAAAHPSHLTSSGGRRRRTTSAFASTVSRGLQPLTDAGQRASSAGNRDHEAGSGQMAAAVKRAVNGRVVVPDAARPSYMFLNSGGRGGGIDVRRIGLGRTGGLQTGSSLAPSNTFRFCDDYVVSYLLHPTYCSYPGIANPTPTMIPTSL